VALPLLSGRECIRAPERLGYRVVRTKGSHARLVCSGRSPVTVPLHDELDRGTLRAMMRAAAISAEELDELLR
jgi:predicted RNA binding protein YcfA (HicA-like mRNA interferase family)